MNGVYFISQIVVTAN